MDIINFLCETGRKSNWELGKLKKSDTSRKLVFLSIGDRLTCHFEFDNGMKKSKLVLGYFDEDISDINIIIEDNESDIEIKLEEI